MKYLVILFALMLSACASTPSNNQLPKVDSGYVRVIGTGKNLEEARLNGFQLAVEIAVGAIVITEKQATNNVLVRDQILKHSSGYVDDFKIIEQSGTSLRYTVVMDVKVRNSQIADVILSTSNKTGVLNSARIYAQYDTINKERDDAEKLIGNLLNSYPKSAFTSNVKYTNIKLNSNRDMVIEISSTLTWNPIWINSFIENLNRVSDKNKNGRKIEVLRKPKSSMFNDGVVFRIDDDQIYNKIFTAIFVPLYPIVEVVDNYGNSIIRGCGYYSEFDSIGQHNYEGVAEYVIPKGSKTFDDLKNMHHVNVYMTPSRDVCLGKV